RLSTLDQSAQGHRRLSARSEAAAMCLKGSKGSVSSAQTAALSDQTRIAQEGLDEQRRIDNEFLDIVKGNATTQKEAYAEQTRIANETLEQQKSDAAASLAMAQ